MPTFKTDVAARQTGPIEGTAALTARGRYTSATLVRTHALFTIPADFKQGDVIQIARLKPAEMVIPHLCQVISEGAATALNLSIGDETVPDRYGKDVAAGPAGSVPFAGGSDGVNIGDITEPQWITATATTATAPAAGKKVLFIVVYSIP